MRTLTLLPFAVAGCLSAGCAESPAPQPEPAAPAPAAVRPVESPAASTSPDPVATTSSDTTAGPLGSLAAALGLDGGGSIPDGLVAGGDCPAPQSDREQDAATQAEVPLREGLTLAYSWMRTPQEEYECLIQVTKIDPIAIETTASCNMPGREKPTPRRICRADLEHARMLHTMYGVIKVIGVSGEEEPEVIVGATAFSLSSDAFARLTRDGKMTHHYVEFGPSGRLQKNGIGDLQLEGRETMSVIVNDRPLDLPVIKARGKLQWWIRGKRLETEDTLVVLDDERFPLLIDQHSSNDSAASRIRFARITHPASGKGVLGTGVLEGNLLANKPVDVYGIYFDFNSDGIRPESEPVLNEIGDLMKKYPDWRLSIQGHTDNVGGNGDYNLRLSRRRSEAVRAALVSRFGIAAERLTSGGSGASAPKDTNETPEGRARNRRVELTRR